MGNFIDLDEHWQIEPVAEWWGDGEGGTVRIRSVDNPKLIIGGTVKAWDQFLNDLHGHAPDGQHPDVRLRFEPDPKFTPSPDVTASPSQDPPQARQEEGGGAEPAAEVNADDSPQPHPPSSPGEGWPVADWRRVAPTEVVDGYYRWLALAQCIQNPPPVGEGIGKGMTLKLVRTDGSPAPWDPREPATERTPFDRTAQQDEPVDQRPLSDELVAILQAISGCLDDLERVIRRLAGPVVVVAEDRGRGGNEAAIKSALGDRKWDVA